MGRPRDPWGRWLAWTTAVALLAAPAGCGRRARDVEVAPGGIRIIGSTTVLPLAERWRAEYNREHPEVAIAVSGGGSGTGIKALISRTAEIAMSSRDIHEDEVARAREAGVDPAEHLVAYDGMAVIVHPTNPLEQISVEMLSDIYTGRVTEWDQVGVPGLGRIQAVSRDAASGTYEAFKELVVQLAETDRSRDYSPAVLKQASNAAIVALVGQTRAAIGYVGLGYLDDSVKALRVAPMGGQEAVSPTMENVMAGRYPLARELHFYTDAAPSRQVREFIDWVRGEQGQRIVEELGFVPVR